MVMSFDIKMIMKSGAIKIVFKSWEPFNQFNQYSNSAQWAGLHYSKKNQSFMASSFMNGPLFIQTRGRNCARIYIFTMRKPHTIQCNANVGRT